MLKQAGIILVLLGNVANRPSNKKLRGKGLCVAALGFVWCGIIFVCLGFFLRIHKVDYYFTNRGAALLGRDGSVNRLLSTEHQDPECLHCDSLCHCSSLALEQSSGSALAERMWIIFPASCSNWKCSLSCCSWVTRTGCALWQPAWSPLSSRVLLITHRSRGAVA